MKNGRSFLIRLPQGSDIHTELLALCAKKKVRKGWVTVIGATRRAKVGYYDQKKHVYAHKEFADEMEILSCAGNVSLKEGKPFAHLHVTLSDTECRAVGGHLFESDVFSAELFLQELKGKPLERLPDQATGLALWPLKER